MIGRRGEIGSGISVLAARHDDDMVSHILSFFVSSMAYQPSWVI